MMYRKILDLATVSPPAFGCPETWQDKGQKQCPAVCEYFRNLKGYDKGVTPLRASKKINERNNQSFKSRKLSFWKIQSARL
jgi:hypothetical protein